MAAPGRDNCSTLKWAASFFVSHQFYQLSYLLQGHCQDCKYRPVRCPNPGCSELMPAEKIDSHVGGNCPFRKVACNHCMEEIAANTLEVTKDINTPGATGVLLVFCSSYLYIGSSELVPQGSYSSFNRLQSQ